MSMSDLMRMEFKQAFQEFDKVGKARLISADPGIKLMKT